MRLGCVGSGGAVGSLQSRNTNVLSLHNYSSMLGKCCQDQSAAATVLLKLAPELPGILCFKRNR